MIEDEKPNSDDSLLSGDKKNYMKPIATYAALVNIMLGTGPFT